MTVRFFLGGDQIVYNAVSVLSYSFGSDSGRFQRHRLDYCTFSISLHKRSDNSSLKRFMC